MAKIGVIMRTKDRPILLRRALQSVTQQTFRDWQLVVVNDGGDPRPVEDLLASLDAESQRKITLVSHPESVGMEAASNVGLSKLKTEYAMIHDDDDSLHPEFFEKTTSYLDKPPHPRVKGAITRTTRIIEKLENGTVEVLDQFPFHDWAESISLRRMIAQNFIAPICFVFNREACEEVGAFREDLPVLGDWDFNVRFLEKYEIGIIPEFLAYYHDRSNPDDPNYTTTFSGKLHLHVFYDNFLRNEWLRKDMEEGKTGRGIIANQAIMFRDSAWEIKKDISKKIDDSNRD